MLGSASPGEVTLAASAEGYRSAEPMVTMLAAGIQERLLTLEPLPGTVTVKVVDAEQRPVAAELRLVGPVSHPLVAVDAAGTATLELMPGRWQIVAATDELGPNRVQVDVEPAGAHGPLVVSLVPSTVTFTAEEVVIRERVEFDFGSASLRTDSAAVLDQVANMLVSHAEIVRLVVEGHSDNRGGIAYNQDLSQRRAGVVRGALVARGVAPEKLVARGFGVQRPIADNESEAGRARNRRVAFQIVETATTD
jgi:outer membrane protein OmpA-like peptidoglycan-associated protein